MVVIIITITIISAITQIKTKCELVAIGLR